MAKAKLDVLFTEYSGHMDNMVYYTVWNKTYAREYVIPRNPKSEAQQAHRSLFAEAMAGWKLLNEEVKQQYRKKTRKLPMHAHNLFISEYIKAHKHENTEEVKCPNEQEPVLIHSEPLNQPQPCSSPEAPPYLLRSSLLSASIQAIYPLYTPPV
ncbi:MAG TPA: hypothetical protein PKG60_01980 [Spirochaetota bacterium]|nr:hypothetical protein [Spirochaetota bacterium]HPS86504.1 hypothetical protein [Spirochaetota bacterium]